MLNVNIRFPFPIQNQTHKDTFITYQCEVVLIIL